MFTFTSKSRKSAAILSAGAAAAVLVSLGLTMPSVRAATYTWDPTQSPSSASDGSGTWNAANLNWYNGSTNVALVNNNPVVIGAGSSTAYNITLAYNPSVTTFTYGNNGNYTINGGSGSYTIAASGRVILEKNSGSSGGTLTLENLTLNNTSYTAGTASNTMSGVFGGGTLNIGSGATLDAFSIDAGGGGSPGTAGTINVSTGGYLDVGNGGIQNNFGSEPTSSSNVGVINVTDTGKIVTTGAITLSRANATETSAVNPTGTLNVGLTGSGSYVSAPEATTAGNSGITTQTGVLNLYSGTVNLTGGTSISSGSTNGLATTDVNVSGGTLTASGTITTGHTGSLTDLTVSGSGYVNAEAASDSITSSSGATTELNVSAGTLTSGHTIDSSGTTDVNLSGTGIINAGQLTSSSGGYTELTMTGGTMTAGQVNSIGTTTLTISGGTFTSTAAISAGNATNLNLSGSGTLDAGHITSNSGGTTDLTMTGGTLNTGQVNSSGTTELAVSGGTFTSTGNISSGGTTTLTISGTGNVGLGGNSITTTAGAYTTTVNLNGGTLSVYQITEGTGGTTTVNFNGGTLEATGASVGLIGGSVVPTNLNVLNGGAVIDNDGHSAFIYNPLLQGAGSNGGLTVKNSGTGGELYLTGANTYTGPTEIQNGATLGLGAASHTGATIADTSLMQIDSGGTLDISNDGAGQRITVGGLTASGGTINVLLATPIATTVLQNLAVTNAATVSGTNIINVSTSGANPLAYGPYTLISDSAGGLTGTFEFSNLTDMETINFNSMNYVLTLGNSSTAETLTVSAVPEPAAIGVLALGGIGLLLLKRRRKTAV